jgi:hypothetical protein
VLGGTRKRSWRGRTYLTGASLKRGLNESTALQLSPALAIEASFFVVKQLRDATAMVDNPLSQAVVTINVSSGPVNAFPEPREGKSVAGKGDKLRVLREVRFLVLKTSHEREGSPEDVLGSLIATVLPGSNGVLHDLTTDAQKQQTPGLGGTKSGTFGKLLEMLIPASLDPRKSEFSLELLINRHEKTAGKNVTSSTQEFVIDPKPVAEKLIALALLGRRKAQDFAVDGVNQTPRQEFHKSFQEVGQPLLQSRDLRLPGAVLKDHLREGVTPGEPSASFKADTRKAELERGLGQRFDSGLSDPASRVLIDE